MGLFNDIIVVSEDDGYVREIFDFGVVDNE